MEKRKINAIAREIRALDKHINAAKKHLNTKDLDNLVKTLKLSSGLANKTAHALIDLETVIRLRMQFLAKEQTRLKKHKA